MSGNRMRPYFAITRNEGGALLYWMQNGEWIADSHRACRFTSEQAAMRYLSEAEQTGKVCNIRRDWINFRETVTP